MLRRAQNQVPHCTAAIFSFPPLLHLSIMRVVTKSEESTTSKSTTKSPFLLPILPHPNANAPKFGFLLRGEGPFCEGLVRREGRAGREGPGRRRRTLCVSRTVWFCLLPLPPDIRGGGTQLQLCFSFSSALCSNQTNLQSLLKPSPLPPPLLSRSAIATTQCTALPVQLKACRWWVTGHRLRIFLDP